jgi:hypothetical protein
MVFSYLGLIHTLFTVFDFNLNGVCSQTFASDLFREEHCFSFALKIVLSQDLQHMAVRNVLAELRPITRI